VRYVTIDHLLAWGVLDPAKVTDPVLRTEVLQEYRKYRKRDAQKLHKLSKSTRAEWLALTVAVAKAAGAQSPSALAERAVAEVESTVDRRSRREALALAGRTPGSGRSSVSLKRRIWSFAAEIDGAEEVINSLVGGSAEMKLRAKSAVVQQTLDLGDPAFGVAASPEEEALAAVLGEGFLCAPNLSDADLVAKAEALLALIREYFVGSAPDADPDLTYAAIAAEVDLLAIAWLQEEVRRRLT
jgi:hypothetical protein